MTASQPGPSDPRQPAAFPGFEVERTERIYDSPWCGLRRDVLRLPEGGSQEYHVVEITDAVVVVPVLPDGRLLLIWQYRHPHGKTHWEVPAGRIHDDEEPLSAARRELREETGYRSASIERAGGFYPINGISDHYSHVFVARDCVADGEARLDRTERISTHVFTRREVRERLARGQFQDGFSALALFYYLGVAE